MKQKSLETKSKKYNYFFQVTHELIFTRMKHKSLETRSRIAGPMSEGKCEVGVKQIEEKPGKAGTYWAGRRQRWRRQS